MIGTAETKSKIFHTVNNRTPLYYTKADSNSTLTDLYFSSKNGWTRDKIKMSATRKTKPSHKIETRKTKQRINRPTLNMKFTSSFIIIISTATTFPSLTMAAVLRRKSSSSSNKDVDELSRNLGGCPTIISAPHTLIASRIATVTTTLMTASVNKATWNKISIVYPNVRMTTNVPHIPIVNLTVSDTTTLTTANASRDIKKSSMKPTKHANKKALGRPNRAGACLCGHLDAHGKCRAPCLRNHHGRRSIIGRYCRVRGICHGFGSLFGTARMYRREWMCRSHSPWIQLRRFRIAKGGHYFVSPVSSDPWVDDRYTTGYAGIATFAGMATIGTTDIQWRAFIVHGRNGERLACGLLHQVKLPNQYERNPDNCKNDYPCPVN